MSKTLQSLLGNFSMRMTVTSSSLVLAAIALIIAGVSAFSLQKLTHVTKKNNELVEALSSMNAAAIDIESYLYGRDTDFLNSAERKLDDASAHLAAANTASPSNELKEALAKTKEMNGAIVNLQQGIEPIAKARGGIQATLDQINEAGGNIKSTALKEQHKLQTVQRDAALTEQSIGSIFKEVILFQRAADDFLKTLPEKFTVFTEEQIEVSKTAFKTLGEPLDRMTNDMFQLGKIAEYGAVQEKYSEIPQHFEALVAESIEGFPPSSTLVNNVANAVVAARASVNDLVNSFTGEVGEVNDHQVRMLELENHISVAGRFIQTATAVYGSTRLFAITPNETTKKELEAAIASLQTVSSDAGKYGLSEIVELVTKYEAQIVELGKQIDIQDDGLNGVVESSSSAGFLMAKAAKVSALETVSTTQTAFILISLGIISLILVALCTSYTMEKLVIAPIKKMADQMSNLSKGDLSVEVAVSDRTNEIGQMERAIGVFHDNAKARITLEEQTHADQERERKRQNTVDGLINEFRQDVGGLMSSFSDQANQMADTANGLNQAADDASVQTENASSYSRDSSSNIQTVAAAAEELAISTQEITRQVSTTTEVVENGARSTQQTSDRISELATSAQKIGDVVDLIRDIAEQTNLLALNATIEAARAGESGKGFAIVAQEVKSLASQTSNATQEIADQISDIQGASDDAVKAIMDINEIMGEVQTNTRAIASSVTQQDSATKEISLSAQKAAEGADETSNNMDGVSNAMDRTTSSAQTILTTSDSLTEGANNLNHRVESFLQKVAAT